MYLIGVKKLLHFIVKIEALVKQSGIELISQNRAAFP